MYIISYLRYFTHFLCNFQGFVMSTFFFGYILTQIAGGILADRFGGNRMLFYSALVWSISTFLIPLLGDFIRVPFTMGIIGLRALSGIAQGQFIVWVRGHGLCML